MLSPKAAIGSDRSPDGVDSLNIGRWEIREFYHIPKVSSVQPRKS